ncbi:hypothetical protein [Mobilicoccus sp.]|nr:hypothetical protein [Mobilicoccus sp.]
MKFHLIAPPSTPPRSRLSQAHKGWASAPLTSTFANIGNVTP